MKFPQLAEGARFRWRGQLYRKTGPMVAQADAGDERKLIPRSAVVEPVDDTRSPPARPATGLAAAEVEAALAVLVRDLLGWAAHLDAEAQRTLERRIATAERAFREQLGL